MLVCLFVCLFVQISLNFLYMLSVAVARSSSDGSAIRYRYVLTVLSIAPCFRIMDGICRIKDTAYFSSSSPGGGTSRTSSNGLLSRSPCGGTGSEVCHSDCVFLIG